MEHFLPLFFMKFSTFMFRQHEFIGKIIKEKKLELLNMYYMSAVEKNISDAKFIWFKHAKKQTVLVDPLGTAQAVHLMNNLLKLDAFSASISSNFKKDDNGDAKP